MNCKTIERYILLEYTTEISSSQSAERQRHLEHCANCRAFARDLATIRRDFLATPVDAPSATVANIMAAAAGRPLPSTTCRRLPRLLVALAASLVICLCLWFTLRQTPPRHQASLPPSAALLAEISDILFALTDPEVWFEQWDDHHASALNIDELAQQILITQGLLDLPEESEETPNLPEEHQPTTLRWRSSPESPAETCG